MKHVLQKVKQSAIAVLMMLTMLLFCPVVTEAAELPEIKTVKVSQNAYSDEKGYTAVSVNVRFTTSKKSADEDLVFRVYRSTSKNGTYKKVGEVSAVANKKDYTFVDKSRYLMPKKTYYYKVRAISGDNKGTYSTSAKIKLKLADAKRSGISYMADEKCIAIRFADPFEVNNGVDNYEANYSKILNTYTIYRSETNNGEYEEIGTVPAIMGAYYDTDIEEGKVYFYKVKSGYYNRKTEKSVYGNLVNFGFCLADDFEVSSKIENGKVKLKWTKVDNAKYYVHEGLSTFDKLLTKTKKTSYTYDLNGKESQDFTVTVYLKMDGKYTETSIRARIQNDAVKEEEEKEEQEVSYPVNVSQLSTSKVKVTWPEVEGAESYRVYRVAGYKDSYIDLEEEYVRKDFVKVGETTETTINDSNVMPGIEYRYIVEADYTDRYMFSDSYSLTMNKATIKSVTNKSSKSATITWGKVKGADEYAIYRSTKKNGTYKKVATVTGTSYKDVKLTKGKTYYYKIKAVNINDFGIATESEFSNRKSVKIKK